MGYGSCERITGDIGDVVLHALPYAPTLLHAHLRDTPPPPPPPKKKSAWGLTGVPDDYGNEDFSYPTPHASW